MSWRESAWHMMQEPVCCLIEPSRYVIVGYGTQQARDARTE